MNVPKYLQFLVPLALMIAFNLLAIQTINYGVRNSAEAGYFWSDEGRHIRMLESIQETGSWKLEHPAYTALYVNTTYAFAHLISLGQSEVSPAAFAYASKIVSLLMLNLSLYLLYLWLLDLFPFPWEGIGLFVLVGQSLHLMFATRLHPEAMLLFWTLLTLRLAWNWWREHHWQWFALASFCAALAVGTKLGVVFLWPWLAGIAVCWLVKHEMLRSRSFGFYLGVGTLSTLLGLMVSTPYQLLHLGELLRGIRTESASQAKLYQDPFWKWFEVIASDLFLNPWLTTLVVLGGGFGCLVLISRSRIPVTTAPTPDSPEYLQQAQREFFGFHLSWVIVGSAYIIATSHAFIDRYLYPVHSSLLLIGLCGVYWFFRSFRGKWVIAVMVLLAVVTLKGVQLQVKTFQRDVERRDHQQQELLQLRRIYYQLEASIPESARIYYTRRMYLVPKDFPNASRIEPFIDNGNLNPPADYLWIHAKGRSGLPSLNWDRTPSPRLLELAQFWQELDTHQLNGEYQAILEFPELGITIYQRTDTP